MERTEAHKGEQCTNLVGRPRRLGFGPANGWAALSKHFGGYLGSAPTGRVLPHLMEATQRTRQRSTEEQAETRSEICQHTKARSTQVQQNKAKQCTTMMAADSHTTRRKHQRQPNTQRPVWGQTHHTGTTPTHSHRRPQTGRARARITGRPRGLGLGPANGWAALSKRFGGCPNSAPTGGAALPG